MSRRWSWALVRTNALVCVACLVAPAVARADAATCVDAANRAQTAIEQKHLVEAQSAAATCAAKECPDVVRADCVRWSKQVRKDIASVVFRVVDRTGTEVAGARVAVEGQGAHHEVAAGELLELDPGSYTAKFARGSLRADSNVSLATGEKSREVVLLTEATTEARDKPTGKSAQTPLWPWPWIAGGVAVVGLATFGLLQASSSSKFNDLEETCGAKGSGAGCPEDDVDGVRRQVVASGVGLGVGLVAGAAAIVLFMMEPKPQKAQSLLAPPRLAPARQGAAVLFAF